MPKSARAVSNKSHRTYAKLFRLAACRTLGVDSEKPPQRGQLLPDLPPHSQAMGQEDGEKCTAAVASQPTLRKSDRLLGQYTLVRPSQCNDAGAVLRKSCLVPTMGLHLPEIACGCSRVAAPQPDCSKGFAVAPAPAPTGPVVRFNPSKQPSEHGPYREQQKPTAARPISQYPAP